MAYTVLGLTVDFSRLVQQRMSPYYHGSPHPWLALGYVVIQAFAALLPGTCYPVTRIHEGLSRKLIGHDKTRRTGIWGWQNDHTTLFIVPGIYTKELYARSRIWMLRGCGWSVCRRVLVDLLRQYRQDHHPLVAELMYRASAYAVLFEQTHAREYVTTNIGMFPESPAVPVANAMGIKTILWLFGEQHVLPTTTGPHPWIVPAAMSPAISEVHLWTDTARWLWEVNFIVNPKPRLIVDGPRMLGLKPAGFLPSFAIGIADTPAKKDAEKYGIFTPEWVETFYRDLLVCATQMSRTTFLVKSKYAEHLIAPSVHKRWLCLLSHVEELDPDSNPWTLIERCGMLICLPFSSMGVAALSVGREVIFYDPTGEAKFYPDPSVHPHYVAGLDALARCLSERFGVPCAANGGTA